MEIENNKNRNQPSQPSYEGFLLTLITSGWSTGFVEMLRNNTSLASEYKQILSDIDRVSEEIEIVRKKIQQSGNKDSKSKDMQDFTKLYEQYNALEARKIQIDNMV